MRLLCYGLSVFLLGSALLPLLCPARSAASTRPGKVSIIDFYTDKARYNPGEPVAFQIRLANDTPHPLINAQAVLSCDQLNKVVGSVMRRFSLAPRSQSTLQVAWEPPAKDFQGYWVGLVIKSIQGQELARGVTAVDVSSNWSIFPRYGYVAHYGKDIPARAWVDELNRFHIDGLQFYDVVYKHHVPLSGTVAHPRDEWPDVAKRPTFRSTVLAFIRSAHSRNMAAMVYDAAYAAYANALHDGSGVRIEWAAWPNAVCKRVPSTIKSLRLPPGWATPRLLYMNLDSPGWRNYIFRRMRDLFQVFPYDGWHIDTYGNAGAYAYDGSYINYIAGLPSFANAASHFLHTQVVVNTVGGLGEDRMADSASDFVYSELWPKDHATYASILRAADQIHAVNPRVGIVFAAYASKSAAWKMKLHGKRFFDPRSVLLNDAVIFAAGAAHIELGDGDRMLSGPYFPADENPRVSPELQGALSNYYNFLVGYENYLRDRLQPASCSLTLEHVPQTLTGEAGAVWTFSREKGSIEIVHLINLIGLRNSEWRTSHAESRRPPVLLHLHAEIQNGESVQWAGWASPDVDGGQFHRLPVLKRYDAQGVHERLVIPILRCWDMVFLKRGVPARNSGPQSE